MGEVAEKLKIFVPVVLFFALLIGGGIYFLQGSRIRSVHPKIRGKKIVLDVNISSGKKGKMILEYPNEGKTMKRASEDTENLKLEMAKPRKNPEPGNYTLKFKFDNRSETRSLGYQGPRLKLKNVSFSWKENQRDGTALYSLNKTKIDIENNGDLPAFVEISFEIVNIERNTSEAQSISIGKNELILSSGDISGGFMSLTPSEYNIKTKLKINEVIIDHKTKKVNLGTNI